MNEKYMAILLGLFICFIFYVCASAIESKNIQHWQSVALKLSEQETERMRAITKALNREKKGQIDE